MGKPSSPKAKKFNKNTSKNLYIIFWDNKCILLIDFYERLLMLMYTVKPCKNLDKPYKTKDVTC